MLFKGVENVTTDSRAGKVVVKGKGADPKKVCERLQKKSGRKVELISPLPKPPEEQPKEEDKQPKEEKKEEVKKAINFMQRKRKILFTCSNTSLFQVFNFYFTLYIIHAFMQIPLTFSNFQKGKEKKNEQKGWLRLKVRFLCTL